MPFPVEVMSVGTWNQTKFTLENLKEIASNFKKLKEVIKPPVKLGHSGDQTGQPALGWVTDLQVKGNKLVAFLDNVPEILMNAIKKKLYRRVSSEILMGFKYKGQQFGRVFSGLALLGAEMPAVKDLDDLTAYLISKGEGEFEEVIIYNFQNDKVKERKAEMEIKEFNKKLEELSKRISTLTIELNDKQATIEKLQTKVAKSDAEKKAFAEEQIKTKIKKFCEDRVKAGFMTPAQRDLLKDESIIILDDNQAAISFASFQEFFENGKKKRDDKNHANDDDHNKNQRSFADPQEEVVRLADEYAAKHKVNYEDAITAVLSDPENKELAEKYTEDFSDIEK